ncbi:MAG: hypothetical protein HYW07_02495 [Candidatus Latescibacteria bacterium]|nr:hypothetical protein [Candidatus Latescibacterota bacterium]
MALPAPGLSPGSHPLDSLSLAPLTPFTPRSLGLGAFFSLCIAIGDPYGNMVIRGSYMGLDFSTPGAVFLFFLLAGLLNHALRLRREELLVVYAMMIAASAIPTMGLSEYLLTIISGVQYYASPENEWALLIQPHIPTWMVPQDPEAIKWFYEGAPKGQGVPWGVWLGPLACWLVLATALYLVMISTTVILRKQWVEQERLVYPIVQVPLEMVQQGGGRPFFRNPAMWAGFALPVLASTFNGLHAYFNFIPALQLVSSTPILRNTVNLEFRLSFPMLGFSYLINLDIAFSLWFFNTVAKLLRGGLNILGISSTEKLGIYGAASEPVLAHQGQGAMIVLVLFGLWIARGHLRGVLRKAFKGDSQVDDSGEILSYRAAVFAWLGGVLVLSAWLWLSGLPAWAAPLTLITALLIFVGLTRVVVEGGVATAVGPMIASSALVSAFGSQVLGPSGMVGMAFTYVWAADIRTFVMVSCAHGLKLSEHLGPRLRPLFWALLLAILVSLIGSLATILHLAYTYGGINLNGWFFDGGVKAPFEYAAVKLNSPVGPDWEGWAHTLVGGGLMALLMLARHQLFWWPLHPIGYPIGAVWLMDALWFSIFLAWLVKLAVLKYGGPQLYRATRPFFLGLIVGQFAIAGAWLIVDYFTGMTDNVVFWI